MCLTEGSEIEPSCCALSLPTQWGCFLVKFLSLHLTAHEILHLESPSSLNFQADFASVRARGATRSTDKHLNGYGDAKTKSVIISLLGIPGSSNPHFLAFERQAKWLVGLSL